MAQTPQTFSTVELISQLEQWVKENYSPLYRIGNVHVPFRQRKCQRRRGRGRRYTYRSRFDWNRILNQGSQSRNLGSGLDRHRTVLIWNRLQFEIGELDVVRVG